jgi:NhaP-type Na+/H+ or K+/H+ antiporter
LTHDVLIGLGAMLLIGVSAQWLAWRLRLPSILLLFVFGFVAGPAVLGLVDPDAVFGRLLLPVVALSVAVILFEGGLGLRTPDLRDVGGVVRNLVTVGALVTWALTSTAAWLLLDVGPAFALLFGAILVVSGPTVVIPLLAQIKPIGRVGSVLRWESIVIDPIGAVLAVLVFEGALAETFGGATASIALRILGTIVVGGFCGIFGAWALVQLLRRYWIPDHLDNAAALAMAVAVYLACESAQHESGLLGVTVLGVAMANQRRARIHHIIEFKENLRVLLLAFLFMLLAARLRMEDLRQLDLSVLAFVGVLALVIRPAAVAISCAGSPLSWRERLFLAWVAPRGIVAAAVSSVFALRLQAAGHEDAARLVPLTFLTILCTVTLYGLTSPLLARRLGVSEPHPQGVLLLGAHAWARDVAAVLAERGFSVLLTDTNPWNVSAARMRGLNAWHGNAIAEYADEELDLRGVGRVLAMTPNPEVNVLATLHFRDRFGRGEVYQLPLAETAKTPAGEPPFGDWGGRFLFSPQASHRELTRRFETGATIKATSLTERFGWDDFRAQHGDDALPLFAIQGRSLLVATVDVPLRPAPGQTVIALVSAAPPDDPAAAATAPSGEAS